MDGKHAYKTGNYTNQSLAMDANYYGVEGSGMNGSILWLYARKVSHTHQTGRANTVVNEDIGAE